MDPEAALKLVENGGAIGDAEAGAGIPARPSAPNWQRGAPASRKWDEAWHIAISKERAD
jgi:hypothetical protein